MSSAIVHQSDWVYENIDNFCGFLSSSVDNRLEVLGGQRGWDMEGEDDFHIAWMKEMWKIHSEIIKASGEKESHPFLLKMKKKINDIQVELDKEYKPIYARTKEILVDNRFIEYMLFMFRVPRYTNLFGGSLEYDNVMDKQCGSVIQMFHNHEKWVYMMWKFSTLLNSSSMNENSKRERGSQNINRTQLCITYRKLRRQIETDGPLLITTVLDDGPSSENGPGKNESFMRTLERLQNLSR
jgi:hypothetical protein